MTRRFTLSGFCLLSIVCAGAAVAQSTDPGSANTDRSAAQSTVSSPQSLTRADDMYRIGYRDKLSVQVFKHPELSQTVAVNPDGTIHLFRLAEPIMAVCKTQRELATIIADAYRKDYLKNPEVNVVAVEQMSQMLSVMGAVEKPNNFFVNRRMHLLELLAMAGGPSKDAGSRVLVARTGSTSMCDPDPQTDDKVGVFNFMIRDLQEGKQTFVMQPGDIVSVLKADLIFVYGNVNEQGQIVMEQPMTLTQAIASAKGIKPATKKDKVRIIRQKPGSMEREEIVVDLVAIDRQKAPDPFLQANDIVALSEDRTKSILNSVARSFTQGIPGLLYRPY